MVRLKVEGDAVMVYPSYPSQRLWTEDFPEALLEGNSVRSFAHYTEKQRIDLNSATEFCAEPKPLCSLFFLDYEQEGDLRPRAETISSHAIFTELLKKNGILKEHLKDHVITYPNFVYLDELRKMAQILDKKLHITDAEIKVFPSSHSENSQMFVKREVEVIARAYQPAGEAFRLEGAERVDRDIIQGITDLPISEGVHPVTLRINEMAPGALPRYWPATNMTPEKHTGYAVQWFTMAFAVTVAWLFFSFPKRELETQA